MSSEIGNKELLRAMANFLAILDVKQAPSRLNTEEVQAVFDLSRGFSGPRTDLIRQGDIATGGPAFTLDGLVTGNVSLVGPFPQGSAFRGLTNGSSPAGANTDPNLDTKVHAASIRIQLDAAGAVALGGAIIDFFFRFDNTAIFASPLGGITNVYTGIFTVDPAITQYNITLGGYPAVDAASGGSNRVPLPWSGFVPAQWVFSSLVQTRGPVFPANSVLTARIAGSQVPLGLQLP